MDRPVGNALTPRTTPLHVYQLLLVVLRETFKGLPDDHPYKLTDDFDTTKILFDTTFNKESGVYGNKPVVIVSRGDASSNPLVIGDRATSNMPMGHSLKTSMVQSSTIVKVVSSTQGHVDILGNEILNILMASRTILNVLTSVTMVNALSLSAVSPFDEGDHMFYCAATMQYMMQYKWVHRIPENILESIKYYYTEEETGRIQAGVSS